MTATPGPSTSRSRSNTYSRPDLTPKGLAIQRARALLHVVLATVEMFDVTVTPAKVLLSNVAREGIWLPDRLLKQFMAGVLKRLVDQDLRRLVESKPAVGIHLRHAVRLYGRARRGQRLIPIHPPSTGVVDQALARCLSTVVYDGMTSRWMAEVHAAAKLIIDTVFVPKALETEINRFEKSTSATPALHPIASRDPGISEARAPLRTSGRC
jgi:hypothetical protein